MADRAIPHLWHVSCSLLQMLSGCRNSFLCAGAEYLLFSYLHQAVWWSWDVPVSLTPQWPCCILSDFHLLSNALCTFWFWTHFFNLGVCVSACMCEHRICECVIKYSADCIVFANKMSIWNVICIPIYLMHPHCMGVCILSLLFVVCCQRVFGVSEVSVLQCIIVVYNVLNLWSDWQGPYYSVHSTLVLEHGISFEVHVAW